MTALQKHGTITVWHTDSQTMNPSNPTHYFGKYATTSLWDVKQDYSLWLVNSTIRQFKFFRQPKWFLLMILAQMAQDKLCHWPWQPQNHQIHQAFSLVQAMRPICLSVRSQRLANEPTQQSDWARILDTSTVFAWLFAQKKTLTWNATLWFLIKANSKHNLNFTLSFLMAISLKWPQTMLLNLLDCSSTQIKEHHETHLNQRHA